MYQKYLVTGALQPVGKLVVELLLEEGKSVRVLVPPEADTSSLNGLDIEIVEGEIFDKDSMKKFFTLDDPRHSAIIHTEEIVSISDETNINMRRINVTGSNNVIDQCIKTKVGRIVCLGSAYAINPNLARENSVISFDRTKVEGDYAKTKAEAAAYIMEKVSLNKLNASILLPTFIIGPGFDDDYDMNKILKSYLEKGVSPIKGGHAFVDVRDVALALSALCEEGQAGGSYVLNGEHKNTEDFFKDVSKANGSDAPVKMMPKWMMGKTFGKFVDTYYRIAKKDNPKEVYALFMNAPDQTFDSTANDMLPSGQVRTIYESIDDVIHNVKVDASALVPKTEEPVEEPEAEVEEAVAEEQPEADEEPKEEVKEEPKEEAPKSILNIPSVLGTLNALSAKKEEEVEAPVEEEPKVEEPEAEEVTEEPEAEAEPEVEAEAEEEAIEEVTEEEAIEEAVEEPAPEVVEEAAPEVVEEAEAPVETEEVAEEITEEVTEEAAPEVVEEAEAPVETEEVAEEITEEVTEEAAPEVEEPVVEEAVEETTEEVVEEKTEDAPVVPIWARPIEGGIDSLDDLDDLM